MQLRGSLSDRNALRRVHFSKSVSALNCVRSVSGGALNMYHSRVSVNNYGLALKLQNRITWGSGRYENSYGSFGFTSGAWTISTLRVRGSMHSIDLSFVISRVQIWKLWPTYQGFVRRLCLECECMCLNFMSASCMSQTNSYIVGMGMFRCNSFFASKPSVDGVSALWFYHHHNIARTARRLNISPVLPTVNVWCISLSMLWQYCEPCCAVVWYCS